MTVNIENFKLLRTAMEKRGPENFEMDVYIDNNLTSNGNLGSSCSTSACIGA